MKTFTLDVHLSDTLVYQLGIIHSIASAYIHEHINDVPSDPFLSPMQPAADAHTAVLTLLRELESRIAAAQAGE